LDRGAGRFLFDLIDGSERWGGAGAAAVAAALELGGRLRQQADRNSTARDPCSCSLFEFSKKESKKIKRTPPGKLAGAPHAFLQTALRAQAYPNHCFQLARNCDLDPVPRSMGPEHASPSAAKKSAANLVILDPLVCPGHMAAGGSDRSS
jgi:hypothetical protein